MNPSNTWYIVKQADGSCTITPTDPSTGDAGSGSAPEQIQFWGPFETQEAAIARRIGLIRAGKCQPVQPAQ